MKIVTNTSGKAIKVVDEESKAYTEAYTEGRKQALAGMDILALKIGNAYNDRNEGLKDGHWNGTMCMISVCYHEMCEATGKPGVLASNPDPTS